MSDMNRLCRDERGQVIVLAAVMIPVLLLLTALVVDVGNWYTHKRQLQNRADAAAFAAAVEYGKKWKACVQTADATLKANTAQQIADSARQYAGDPDAADYAGGVLPSGPLQNTQIANQAHVNTAINSTSYDDNTDYSDDGDGNAATTLGNPCYNHPNSDSLSAPGYWTDVKVKERDLPSLFGGIGLPLSRNGARARVEIRPAISGTRFLPLAVPDNQITKVQVRYYDLCHNTLLATKDLKPLSAANQAGYASTGGGMLWGLPGLNPDEGDPSLSFGLNIPAYDSACGDYLAVGTQVRIASQDNIDLNQTCNALASSRFADCFSDLSRIRVYNGGNPNAEPRITNVHLTGGCGGAGDAYFSTLPTGSASCNYGGTVEVLWGNRTDPPLNVPANFSVKVNGVSLNPPGGNPSGVWTTSGNSIPASSAGPNTVTVALDWADTNVNHEFPVGSGNKCKNGNNNPCKYSGSQPVQQVFLGTKATSGAVGLVRNSASPFAGGLPSAPYDSTSGGATVQIFPTIGTVSVLKSGVFTTLRLDDPQANQTLRCDPDYAQGQEFSAFLTGCKPWYGKNTWTSPWWTGNPKSCPSSGNWFSYGNTPLGKNSSTNYWQCVLTAPGMSTGQIGDDIAVATDNCNRIQNNSCGNFACNYDGNYDGKTGNPNGWVQQGGDARYPRVVNLFIVPYQSSKGLSGAGDTIPILGFASFYVTNWTGANNNQSDPCPDTTWDNDGNPVTPQINLPATPKGAISGFFVETVDYEPGPVDPNATCVEGQLTPCRAVLTR
jgi:Putative Flp pilus-assembly TadE/G-like